MQLIQSEREAIAALMHRDDLASEEDFGTAVAQELGQQHPIPAYWLESWRALRRARGASRE